VGEGKLRVKNMRERKREEKMVDPITTFSLRNFCKNIVYVILLFLNKFKDTKIFTIFLQLLI